MEQLRPDLHASSDETLKLDTNDKQSRADITDLMGILSVYYARLLRIHNARMSALSIKGGGKVKHAPVKMSLFMAETEQFTIHRKQSRLDRKDRHARDCRGGKAEMGEGNWGWA